MPNIAQVMKQEISRLARKEIRTATATMRKDVIRLKKEMAEQKRKVARLEKENKRLARIALPLHKEMVKPEEDEVERARITGKMIKRLRSKFDMSQTDLGRLVGVTAATVCYWEQSEGTLTFRGNTKAAVVEVRKLGKKEAQKRLEKLQATAKTKAPAKKRRKAKKTRAKRKKR